MKKGYPSPSNTPFLFRIIRISYHKLKRNYSQIIYTRKEELNNIKSILTESIVVIIVTFYLAFCAIADEYPIRHITLIVPYAAGGSVDAIARPLANAAKGYLGQPVIVEDKPGGAGIVSAKLVLTKSPDGYNIGITSLNPILISYHMGKLDFHPTDDFTYIMRLCGFSFGITVKADSPWKSIQEFIQYCQENPKKVNYASAGVGSTGHLHMEEFASTARIQLTHVPYRSGTESNTAVLGGHVDALSDATWHPLVDAGKLRLLLIYASNRSPNYPQVPTSAELGYGRGREAAIVIFGPKGLPQPIVKKLHDVFRMAMDYPEFKAL